MREREFPKTSASGNSAHLSDASPESRQPSHQSSPYLCTTKRRASSCPSAQFPCPIRCPHHWILSTAMPPNQSAAGVSRGRPPGSKNKAVPSAASSKERTAAAKGKQRAQPSESPERRQHGSSEELVEVDQEMDDDEDDEQPEKTIPPELLTRILHEFFEKDGTRMTKDANNALAKYMDIFVKEAIARAAAERDGGFLEVSLGVELCTCSSKTRELTWAPTSQVEDLEKIAPQLLFDL
jgi:centromere protein X